MGTPGGVPVASSSEAWRSNVQALRGLSVLAVILNHLGLTWIPAGYLGVDVFFVISGFVITGSFLRSDRTTSRRASFQDFWIRRFFRLWPSLFAVVVLTAAFLVLTSAARPGSILTGLTSLFGLSNVRLMLGRLEYFALDTSADWFMHLWSLSVEEQIYLVLSLMFLVSMRTKDTRTPLRTGRLGAVLGAATLVSLVLALAPSTHELVRFYSPHTRFYQVGCGALLAILANARSDRLVGPCSLRIVTVARWVSLLGLLCLLVVEVEPFRFGSLLITACATVYIWAIVAGKVGAGLRGIPFLVALGDRSYSMYLVHWPIYLAAEMLIERTAVRNLASLAGTLVVGSISWKMVEESFRFRFQTLSRSRASLTALASLVVVAMATGAAFIWADQRTRPVTFDGSGAVCGSDRGRWWLIGDSHLKALESEIVRATNGDCTVVGGRGAVINYLVLDESPDGRQTHRAFLVNPAELIAEIEGAEEPPEALLIIHWLTGYLSAPETAPESASAVTVEWFSSDGVSIGRERFLREFSVSLGLVADALRARGGSLVVVSPPPDFNWLRSYVDPIYCSGRFFVSRECAMTRTEARISAAEHELRGGGYRRTLDDFAGSHSNVFHISLDEPFCNPDFCSNYFEGELVFGDDDHLNPAGARLVGHNFDQLATKLAAQD